MLQLSDISKRFGDSLLFEKVNLTVNAGERIGLVGPNGCGKSTLLRIIMGQERADSGSAQFSVPSRRVGYLAQSLVFEPDATVRGVLRGDEQDESYWVEQIERLAEQMTHGSAEEMAAIEKAYTTALEHLEQASERLPDHVIAEVLAGLHLSHIAPETPVAILSGGQKTRLGLAKLLLAHPALLLLDEPTNHLDITALQWLEGYLSAYAGGMLIVSHDRAFLDHTVNTILDMDPVSKRVQAYAGGYSAYAERKAREAEKLQLAYNEQQARIARLQGSIRDIKGHARNIENETIDFHYRKQAKKIARQGVMQQRRLQRMLDSEEMIEKPRESYQIKLAFEGTPPSGQDVVLMEDLVKAFGERVLFSEVSLTLRRGDRIALLGANGSGKTTLLRIIVGEQEPTAGSVRLGANVHWGYLSQEQERLDPDATPLELVQRTAAANETEARTLLHRFLFAGDEVFTPIGSLSFGQRARLGLGVLVLQGCNLLLLDEPINHLDIPSRERFEQALQGYQGTILAVVHDRYFVDRFASAIWSLEDQTVRTYVDLEDLARGQRERERV